MHQFYGPIDDDFAAALGYMVWAAMEVEGMSQRVSAALNPEHRDGQSVSDAARAAKAAVQGKTVPAEVQAVDWLEEAGTVLRNRNAVLHATVAAHMDENGTTVADKHFHNVRGYWGKRGAEKVWLEEVTEHPLTVEELGRLRSEFDHVSAGGLEVDVWLALRPLASD